MDIIEQLGIFLYAVVTNLSIRKLAERFQRSTETVQRTYHKVMRHFLQKDFYNSVIQYATENTPLHHSIEGSRNWYPYFKDCIRAVDGTHLPVSPPFAERQAWRDRNGDLTQNVLAICNFDMRFTDVLVGWEGSAADSTIWIEGNRNNEFFPLYERGSQHIKVTPPVRR
jgi:hypothetical protein